MRVGKRERLALRVAEHERRAIKARVDRVSDNPIFTSLQDPKFHGKRWRNDWAFNSSNAKSIAAKRRHKSK